MSTVPTALLIKRQLRKRPGQALTVLLLTVLASAMLHTALVIITDYSTNVDRKATQWNSPTSLDIVGAGPGVALLEDALRAEPDVTALELNDSYGGVSTVDIDGEKLTALINVVNIDDDARIGAPNVVARADDTAGGIWAPSVLEASGAYALGDEIEFDTTMGTSSFRIVGFVEDLFGGAPGMGALTFALSDADFRSFEAPGFQPTVNVKVNSASTTGASAAVYRAMDKVQQELGSDEAFFSWWGHDLSIAKATAGIATSVFVAMLGALAAVIVLVVIVVIRFVLKNLITTDMAALGTLRAAGYSTGGIMGSLVATYGVITVVGALVGTGLSYPLLPVLSRSFRAQNGISWEPSFSLFALVVTVATMLAIVVLVAGLAALRVRKTSTVQALRGGSATHAFTVDPLPLASSRGSLPTLLGLKAAVRQSGQNALLVLTVAIVAFAGVFTLGMVDSLLGDRDRATQLMVGNVEDVSIAPRVGTDAEQLLAEVRALPGVERAFFQTMDGILVDGVAIGFLITPDPAANAMDPLAEGRAPAHDNEVAVGGRLTQILDLKVGDTATFDVGSGPAEYVVTGVMSSVRNMGQNLTFSSDGYRRLQPTFRDSTIAVFTDDPEALIATVKARFGAELESVTNQRQNMDAQLSSYLSMVPIISTFTVGFIVLVTVLVVSLVVSTMLVATHRELGIKKAMGFTSSELAAQTRWTYLPSIVLGALVGTGVSALTLSPLLQALLSQVGLMKIEAHAGWGSTLAIALGILLIGLVVLWVSSLRIRRVSAYALVTE